MSLQEDVQRQVLERLGMVFVSARQAVESVLSGQHRSLRRGLSVEFAGHRPYQPGDDLRRLDWLVYARSDRYDIRVFEEETRLRTTIVLDASGSMGYRGEGMGKLTYGRLLAAALGFLLVRQSDAVGLAITAERVRSHLAPAAAMGHVLTLLDHLEAVEPAGETRLGACLEALAPSLGRRGLIVIISDGLDDPEAIGRGLRLLRERRQDVRMLVLSDPDEETFPFQGMVSFVGLEREGALLIDADRVRGHYHQAVQAHRHRLRELCHTLSVPLALIRTDEDLARTLVRVLAPAEAARP
jgi:uncharacterized protein (DUF58 family)